MPITLEQPGSVPATSSAQPSPSAYVAMMQPRMAVLKAQSDLYKLRKELESLKPYETTSLADISMHDNLDRLKLLDEDWDGYGADPIDEQMIDLAHEFLYQYSSRFRTYPQIVPMTRGRLQFEWHRGNRSLEIEFEIPGEIHYLKWDSDQGIEDEDIVPLYDRHTITALLDWFSKERRNGRSAGTRSTGP